MSDEYIEIHGFRVKYDASSDTLKKGIKYLSEELDESEAKAIFENARHDRKNHTAHFEVSSHRSGGDKNLTLVYREGEGYYRLRKRSRRFGLF